jgi:hypothetical protein
VNRDDDDALRQVLQESRAIAIVGHSDKPGRASYQVAHYLRQVGYTVVPVNPAVARIGNDISYPSLSDVPIPIDIVDVFRHPVHLAGIVDEAIALNIPTVWAQLGVVDELAFGKALDSNLNVIMDRCIKIEHQRLMATSFP